MQIAMNTIAALSTAPFRNVTKVRRPLSSPVSRLTLLLSCVVLVALVGYLDYLTGYEQSLLLFYLVPISLATWFEGLTFGLAFCALSLGVWVVSDVLAGIPSLRIWNLIMGATAYLLFTFLLHKLRAVLQDLDQRVRDRTVALRREIAERERLDREIAEVADRERLRLGQELHDGLCQHLTGTALTAQTLRERLAARGLTEAAQADQIVRYIEEGIDMSRNLARGLFSPELEADGLMMALQGLAENMTDRFKVPCQFDSDGVVKVSDGNMATNLYRLAQEAVMNAIKHAGASRIDIHLSETESDLTLKVSDNGVGLTTTSEHNGLGLRLMTHGAALMNAHFEVKSQATGGTTVLCRVNLNGDNENES
jgi:signal transduction histidine kinase